MGFRTIGGSGGTTNVPTRPKITFPSDRAGLTGSPFTVSMTAVAANTDSSVSLGTLSSAVDGFYIQFICVSARTYRININDGTTDIVSNHALSTKSTASSSSPQWLPIRVASGKTLTLRVACETANPGDVIVHVRPYTLDVAETVTKIVGLGSASTVGSIGGTATLNGTTPTIYTQLSADIGAAAKGLKVHFASGGDNSRPTNGKVFVEFAIGASGSEVVMNLPTIFGVVSGNSVNFIDQGPFWFDIPANSRISFRAYADAAGVTDTVNAQAIILQ